VVVIGVDQLQRQHAHAEQLADLLVAERIAPLSIAGQQRVAAKERIAGAFEAKFLRRLDDLKPVGCQPAPKMFFFALPLAR
jgi:hypothetical protein